MSATRYASNPKKVVLYCQPAPACGASIEVPGTSSTLVARNVARRDHGWDCPSHARRTARDRCPKCPPSPDAELSMK